MTSPYDAFEKNDANFIPLTPVSFLKRTADIFPNRLAFIYGDMRRSWGEVNQRCLAIAKALQNRGLGKGDTVAILAPNIPELLESHYSIPLAGCVLNAINIRLEAETIAYILEHGETKLLIVDSEFSELASQALKLLKHKIPVIDIMDRQAPLGRAIGELDYEALIKEGESLLNHSPLVNSITDEWQALALNYTSGTSGRPKGVVYHHRGAYLMSMGTVTAWDLAHHPVYLYTVPMFHCNGWCQGWTMTLVAGTIVFIRKISAEAIFSTITEHKVNHFGGAPIVLAMLIDHYEKQAVNFDHKVKVVTAGAPPPAIILQKMSAIGFEVMQVYGLTETYGHVTEALWREEWNDLSPSDQAEKQSYQGVSFPMMEDTAVIDRETGKLVPRDGITQGEIVIRGNCVMKGYFKNPEATAEAFQNGWFFSGDAAVWHENGYIQIKDRLKDVIISGGENISSVELEGVLYRHPAVAAAAVVAKADLKWGEVPCAFIEVKPNASLSEAEIDNFCKQYLAGFKRPKAYIFQEIPKTATGKIQKFKLRELVKNL